MSIQDPHAHGATHGETSEPRPQTDAGMPAAASDATQAAAHSAAADAGMPAAGTQVAAFFDLDKTIIATSSAYAFGKEFMNNGLISPGEAMQISLAKASYMMVGQSSEQMDSARDQLSHMVAGWSAEEVDTIVANTMNTVVTPAIYAEARELIAHHQAAGHTVVIISASASTLVRPIARELGVELVVATELEVVDGKFTGNILRYLKGQAKADALLELVTTHGIDVSNSFAYSDSATDIPMLELVGNPVAVNPDRAMKKHALEHGWEIRTFKDPVPLFSIPTAREVGIGAGVVAGLAAVVAVIATSRWLTGKPRPA